MPSWDELFKLGATFEGVEPEVNRAAQILLEKFQLDAYKTNIWDLGCGTGRHSLFLARLGFTVYASDNSPTALSKTREVLEGEGLYATLAEAEMEESPFEDTRFHGIILWNVIQHATADKIARVISILTNQLIPRGILVMSVKSDKSQEAGQGEEVEPGTYIMGEGPETGVPHHYFTRTELEYLLSAYTLIHFVERQEDLYAVATSQPIGAKKLPYHNAHWIIIAQKKTPRSV